MWLSNFFDNRIFTILLLFEAIVFGVFIGAVALGQVSDITYFTDNSIILYSIVLHGCVSLKTE